MKHALEEFQSAEQRVGQSSKNATKGTLSGQIFVSARGGQNFKLGAVQVSLFDRNAIETLIKAEKIYADDRIQQLGRSVDAAKTAQDQADAADRYWSNAYFASRYDDPNRETLKQSYEQTRGAAERAREEYERITTDRNFYYSGAFYFGRLIDPIQTAETDAEGKFVLDVPIKGSFVIAAKTERYVGKPYVGEIGIDVTEHYFWLQPVSLEGQQQRVQNLSNNNLTSTTGTSSLILTKD